MSFIFEKIAEHKKVVLAIFIILVIFSLFLSNLVSVNYNLADYLPSDAGSTIALNIMEEEFTQDIPNVRVMISDISIPQALEYKNRISQVEGVEEVTWLDDAVDIYAPLETLDTETVETWYKNGSALFSVTVEYEIKETALKGIREIIGEKGAMSGSVVNSVAAAETAGEETKSMMFFIVPIVFAILLLTGTSWFEPVLFLIPIGIAIVMNNGTNALLGEISFVSQSCGSILQLAVSMDYAIFLLHRYSEFRRAGMDVKRAVIEASKKAFVSILACALTTGLGFAALTLMRFKIGADLGIVLSKAIMLSIFSVIFLLPVLVIFCHKLVERTQHRPLVSGSSSFGRFMVRQKIPALIIFLLVVPVCFLAQSSNTYYYGSAKMFGDETTQVGREKVLIENNFGKSVQMVLLVPQGDFVKEKALSEDIRQIPEVTSVVSYVDSIGEEIPVEYVPEATLSQLISEHYSRMLISVDTEYEGDIAFAVVENIRSTAAVYYGDSSYLVGESVNTYDLKQVVKDDNFRVDVLCVAAILLVLLLSFRSVVAPVLLLLVIKAAVWVNLSVPYFSGDSIFYVCYLIISCIQLGATVDYAILFGHNYFDNRIFLPKRDAAVKTIKDSMVPILTSASIMFAGGTILGMISSNGVVYQIGLLVGRGAVVSAVFVLLFLPVFMVLLDKIIRKTTIRCKFID